MEQFPEQSLGVPCEAWFLVAQVLEWRLAVVLGSILDLGPQTPHASAGAAEATVAQDRQSLVATSCLPTCHSAAALRMSLATVPVVPLPPTRRAAQPLPLARAHPASSS